MLFNLQRHATSVKICKAAALIAPHEAACGMRRAAGGRRKADAAPTRCQQKSSTSIARK